MRTLAATVALAALVIFMISLVAVDPPASAKKKAWWPAWRGPESTGSVATGTYASSWSATDKVLWNVKLPGVGRSTPIVTGEHILITCPSEGQDAVIDFDWKGNQRWLTKVGKAVSGKHRNGSGSNGSPVTDGDKVFAYFRSGNLAGLELDGERLWKTNVYERFGKDTLWWDAGTSPVLTEKHVVVAVMHDGDSYLAAFDKAKGDLAWKVARNYETPVENDHAYTTPTVVRDGDRELILVWGAEHVTAHSAKDGSVVWSCGGFNPEGKSNWVAVASAVVAGDVIVVPYGRGGYLAGVKLGGKGDVTKTHRLWTRKDVGAFVPTPAVHDGKVYVVRDRGEVVCIDAKSGETVWTGQFPKHRSSYYASPVVANGTLYAPREDGVVLVAKVETEFEFLAENDMGESLIASPVPVDGQILIRSQEHLYCID